MHHAGPEQAIEPDRADAASGRPVAAFPAAAAPRGEGRDEMNLADFPISVLQRRQPAGEDGRKLDTVVFEASRFDAQAQRRVPQKVTLTTSARYGLPTPADEHVVLGLLSLARRSGDFPDPR